MAPIVVRPCTRPGRHLRALTLLLVLILPCLTRAHPVTASQILFADDFNDGNDAGWNQTSRQFHVVDGRYYLDGDYLPDYVTRGGLSFTHVGDPTWADYTMTFTFDTTNALSDGNSGWAGTAAFHQASVIVRAQEQAYYRVDFWTKEPYAGAGTTRLVRARGRINESTRETGLAHSSIVPVRLGTNSGMISVEGSHIRVYLNRRLAIDYRDNQSILYGGIAVGARWEMNAWFDDITIVGEAVALPLAVPVDIIPQVCPNPLRTDSLETLKVVVVGTAKLGVRSIDPASIRLEGVAPNVWWLGDIASPYQPYTGKSQATDCTIDGREGISDLTLKFSIPRLAATLGQVEDGEVRVLHLTGRLTAAAGGHPIVGEDVVVLHPPAP